MIRKWLNTVTEHGKGFQATSLLPDSNCWLLGIHYSVCILATVTVLILCDIRDDLRNK